MAFEEVLVGAQALRGEPDRVGALDLVVVVPPLVDPDRPRRQPGAAQDHGRDQLGEIAAVQAAGASSIRGDRTLGSSSRIASSAGDVVLEIPAPSKTSGFTSGNSNSTRIQVVSVTPALRSVELTPGAVPRSRGTPRSGS